MADTGGTTEVMDRENKINYTPFNVVGTEDRYSEELSDEVDPVLFLSSFFYALFHPLIYIEHTFCMPGTVLGTEGMPVGTVAKTSALIAQGQTRNNINK